MTVGKHTGEIMNIPRLSPYCPTSFDRAQKKFANIDFNTPQAAQTGCPTIVLLICEATDIDAGADADEGDMAYDLAWRI